MACRFLKPRPLLFLVQQHLLRTQLQPPSAYFTTNQQLVNKNKSPKPGNVLSRSTVLVQDGLEIQELPVLLRKIDSREFPFDNISYAGDEIRRVNEQDVAFESRLKECSSVYQIFQLLEVPGDAVTAHSAALALRRVMHFQRSSNENVDSFIKKAVLNELCETICKDIGALDSDFVINLVQCFPGSTSFDSKHIRLVIDEVERRVVDSVFTVSELCHLVNIFNNRFWKQFDTRSNIFIQLMSKQKEIDHFNIRLVYSVMRHADSNSRYLWRILDKRIKECWWKLDSLDVSVILQTLVSGNHYNSNTLSCLSKWLSINIHAVKDVELKQIISGFSYFMYNDRHLIKSLENYVSAKINFMDRSLVAMIMGYCLKIRYLSPRIFEPVGADFERNYSKYTESDMLRALRPFGQLNYLPRNASGLFSTIENYISSNFASFSVADIVELLASFVYVERFPINFIKKIFTPHIVAQVRAMPSVSAKRKAAKHLLLLQYALKVEFPQHAIPFMDHDYLGNVLGPKDDRLQIFHPECKRVLELIFPDTTILSNQMPKGTPYNIDFVVPIRNDAGDEQKMAVLCMMPQDYCVNIHHLLGESDMKRRHIAKLGYSAILVDYEKFSWRCQTYQAKKEYLQSLIQPVLVHK